MSEKSSGPGPSELQNSRFVHHSTYVAYEGCQEQKYTHSIINLYEKCKSGKMYRGG